ncbi:MAG: hypothetical protein LBU64_08780 [Planctomycetota bacterium]|nr:hypothetical protein [Planctomycetota bacterium]
MNKLGIIGAAGGVGATMAFHAGHQGFFDEIAMVDIKRDPLTSHRMDIEQSVGDSGSAKFFSGGWEFLEGCDIVFMAASAPQPRAGSRNEFLRINRDIVVSAAEAIGKYCPDAVVFTATCPTDVFNYVFHRKLGGDRRRFIGLTRNDTVRLRWAVSRVLGVEMRRVDGMVVGEHGASQVPLYGMTTIDGKPANLRFDQITEVDAILKNYFAEQMRLDANRSSTWLTPTSSAVVLRALCGKGQDGPIPASAVLDGEYGMAGLSLGVPVWFGAEGWSKIEEVVLSAGERSALEASGERVRSMIDACGPL